jgi:hypothetical protein
MVKDATDTESMVRGALKKPRKSPVKAAKVKRGDDALSIPDSERKAVENWCQEIRYDKYFFQKKFETMRENMEYVRLGADKAWVDNGNYTVPIIGRFINQAVSALYAKNPKAQAKRKQKMMYTAWDGTQESAQAALSLMQSGQPDPTGQAAAVLSDVKNAQAYDQ